MNCQPLCCNVLPSLAWQHIAGYAAAEFVERGLKAKELCIISSDQVLNFLQTLVQQQLLAKLCMMLLLFDLWSLCRNKTGLLVPSPVPRPALLCFQLCYSTKTCATRGV